LFLSVSSNLHTISLYFLIFLLYSIYFSINSSFFCSSYCLLKPLCLVNSLSNLCTRFSNSMFFIRSSFSLRLALSVDNVSLLCLILLLYVLVYELCCLSSFVVDEPWLECFIRSVRIPLYSSSDIELFYLSAEYSVLPRRLQNCSAIFRVIEL
jgi:hypothetical protein